MRQMIAVMGLYLLGVLGSMTAQAGAGSSGGGDNFSEDAGAAWFLGEDRTIQACLEISADFGVSAGEARAAVSAAFKSWKSYIAEKLPHQKLDIASQLNVRERCAGDEDIVFYLGTMTEEVRAAWNRHTNPTAFAYRRSYDRQKGWGQGWIWVAAQGSVIPAESFPRWASGKPPALSNASLDTILVHEIGHVFGVPHVEGTIMTEGISERIRRTLHFGEASIDTSRELILCRTCPTEKFGELGMDPVIFSNETDFEAERKKQEREKYRLLMGRDPKGDRVEAVVRSMPNSSDLVLEVKDSESKDLFRLQFATDMQSQLNQTLTNDSTPVFKRMIREQQVPSEPGTSPIFFGSPYQAEPVQGYVLFGTLVTKAGRSVPVIVERNLPEFLPGVSPGMLLSMNAGFRIKMLLDGQVRVLFMPFWLTLTSGPVQIEPKPGDPSIPGSAFGTKVN